MPFNHETGKFINFSGETTNSAERRISNNFFKKYLEGKSIIDIGCGQDPITDNAFKYDPEYDPEYDGHFLSDISDKTFDVVYSSHLLEDSMCPYLTMRNWWRVLKFDGYLIITVPHRDLYERKKNLPSDWNPNHKFFILPDEEELPYTINFKLFIKSVLLDMNYQIEYMEICDGGVVSLDGDHSVPEYQIEVVIKKLK